MEGEFHTEKVLLSTKAKWMKIEDKPIRLNNISG
jgi:hypothetical protein